VTRPPIVVIMGVSGSGKSTVAKRLAQKLGWLFQEGDDLHPPANIAKMSAGLPLNDADRIPWLAAIANWIETEAFQGRPAIITCSGLKRVYRDFLRQDRCFVRMVFLEGPEPLIAGRVAARKGHFMPPDLLQSQFDDLEPPAPDEGVLFIPIDQPLDAQVDEIKIALTALH
jgi:gluconokinase